MNYHKYVRDLMNYHYLQGETEELDEFVVIAA